MGIKCLIRIALPSMQLYESFLKEGGDVARSNMKHPWKMKKRSVLSASRSVCGRGGNEDGPRGEAQSGIGWWTSLILIELYSGWQRRVKGRRPVRVRTATTQSLVRRRREEEERFQEIISLACRHTGFSQTLLAEVQSPSCRCHVGSWTGDGKDRHRGLI